MNNKLKHTYHQLVSYLLDEVDYSLDELVEIMAPFEDKDRIKIMRKMVKKHKELTQ